MAISITFRKYSFNLQKFAKFSSHQMLLTYFGTIMLS
jgi:hypothetical protein